jgi:hypothetical protein
MHAGQHHFLPSAQFKQLGPELEREMRQFGRELDQGNELQALLDPLMRRLFDQCRIAMGADSGAIWLANNERTRLAISYDAPREDLAGLEVPIGSGIISLVLASEQGLCEAGAYRHARHDKSLDQRLGRVTSSMVACPFYISGELRGVLSFVKWKSHEADPDPPPFQAVELIRTQQLSAELERLLNLRILQILFDLDRGQL